MPFAAVRASVLPLFLLVIPGIAGNDFPPARE
jgi:hypothetical protein